MHGRLALAYWPTVANEVKPVADRNRRITCQRSAIHFEDITCDHLSILLTVPLPGRSAAWELRLGKEDWQGIAEGYYQPAAHRLAAQQHRTNFFWIGYRKIPAHGFTPEQFEALYLAISEAMDQLRVSRHHYRAAAPLGRFWGFVSLRDYMCERSRAALGKDPQPVFGNSFNQEHEDFGYYVVRTPVQEFLRWHHQTIQP